MAELSFSTMCPQCRERNVALSAIPYTDRIHYEAQEHELTIPDLVVPQCGKCGRISFNREANLQLDAAFRKHVGILTPEELLKHRTALGLSLQQLADKMGVPVESLALWEEGGQFQPRRYDNALRVVFKLPVVPQGAPNKQALQSPGAAAAVT